MKQNLTLSLEKELLRKGKILAAKKDTSVSKLVADTLRQAVDREELYEASKRNALASLRKGFHLGGRIDWKREELHER